MALVYFCDTSWQSSLISEALWFLLIALLMVTLCNIKIKKFNSHWIRLCMIWKSKTPEKGVIWQNQRLTLITPRDLRSPSHMKAKFKIRTFKLITFLPLHRISSQYLNYFATCSVGYTSSGILVRVHLYILAPPQQSFIQGSSAPRSNHWVILLYTMFGRKGTLFLFTYLNLLTNATPFTDLV